jgi:hypothetical protein
MCTPSSGTMVDGSKDRTKVPPEPPSILGLPTVQVRGLLMQLQDAIRLMTLLHNNLNPYGVTLADEAQINTWMLDTLLLIEEVWEKNKDALDDI